MQLCATCSLKSCVLKGRFIYGLLQSVCFSYFGYRPLFKKETMVPVTFELFCARLGLQLRWIGYGMPTQPTRVSMQMTVVVCLATSFPIFHASARMHLPKEIQTVDRPTTYMIGALIESKERLSKELRCTS